MAEIIPIRRYYCKKKNNNNNKTRRFNLNKISPDTMQRRGRGPETNILKFKKKNKKLAMLERERACDMRESTT